MADTTKRAVDRGGRSALEAANQYERKIQLEGRSNPNIQLASGETLAEYQERMFKEHSEEGKAAAENQRNHMRAQSIKNDPLYSSSAEVVSNEAGSVAIVPSAQESEPAPAEKKQVVAKPVQPPIQQSSGSAPQNMPAPAEEKA